MSRDGTANLATLGDLMRDLSRAVAALEDRLNARLDLVDSTVVNIQQHLERKP